MKIAVVGGAGALGSGLAWRWARAGHEVIIGSREPEKAELAASALRARLPSATIGGTSNLKAAVRAEVIAVAVPFSAQRDTLISIATGAHGKIVIDATVALRPPKVGIVQLSVEGSAGMVAAEILGSGVKLVSAFQNVAADLLGSDVDLDCDVLVSGNDMEACLAVCALAGDAGMRGFHVGPIENSVAAEALTSILITLNRKHRGSHAGIRLTGIAHTAA